MPAPAVRCAILGALTPLIIAIYATSRTQAIILLVVFAVLWLSLFVKTWRAAEVRGAQRVFDGLYRNRATKDRGEKIE